MLESLLQPASPWPWLLLVPLLFAGMRIFEWRNVYKPTRKVYQDPGDAGMEFEDITFYAEDGKKLHGWWLPHPQAAGTLLYCHGNAYNIADRLPLLQALHALEVNIFIFDYRGYGNSSGLPSEHGTYRDARAAFEVVRSRYDDEEDPPVVVYGCSMGAGVATQLTLDKNPRGLVIESTFTSIPDMAARIYPWLPCKWFIKTEYDNLSRIASIKMPKLFAHSKGDTLIPYDFGRELFKKAQEPKEFFELYGDHSENSWDVTPGYKDHLKAFIERCLS